MVRDSKVSDAVLQPISRKVELRACRRLYDTQCLMDAWCYLNLTLELGEFYVTSIIHQLLEKQHKCIGSVQSSGEGQRKKLQQGNI